ncbi:hypothetical protein [Sphingomonas sp. HMP6]|uniref:hypothetical protein n=1 Tax=Sphingomonas sp. HMP6 TaxID=1517551 RepID=UPI001596D222|nr:hypothetical protein [Sphingomonas sp. HMP6]BCA60052.1 hypothetical protein HMP06_2821 [Sphingomonas sp. HMP6]
MITVTVFLGSSFDNGAEWDDFDFPAVPRIGECIRQPSGVSDKVRDVEYFVNGDGIVRVRVLLPNAAMKDAMPTVV